jgi:8-oxo-dGTP pyrophosphatase MutT (NUDIX family)
MSLEQVAALLAGEGAFSKLDADGFRLLAGRTLFGEAGEPFGDFLLNPEFREWVFEKAVKPAAVLIPIVKRRDELTVLMTKRTEKLSNHSGQIAFAGGRVDEEDESVVSAALREAQEEIGLAPQQVEVLGTMPEYFTGSGYRISPVVALVEDEAELTANPDEVEYIFEVPLSFLMDDDNHVVGSREFAGKTRYYLEMPFGEHYIWGVTAGIIKLFHDRLKGQEPASVPAPAESGL